MKLRVAPVNEFLKPLEDQTCSEKEQVTFECQMLDEEGDAEDRIRDEDASQERVAIVPSGTITSFTDSSELVSGTEKK